MSNSRTLVIGDIHGAFKALKQVLERAEITKNDHLIFLGDYVDGWSEPHEVIQFLLQLEKSHHCIFIKGNHDALFLQWLRHKNKNELWLHHGGQATVNAYNNLNKNTIEAHIDFLSALKNYHLDTENRLFVHAGFTNLKGVQFEYFPELFYWDRTLWETALALNSNMSKDHVLYPKRLLQYHEVYIGHTPVTRIGKSIPVRAANIWNIDTGAAYKSPLTILDIDNKNYWQSDPVHTLYPNEKGRN